MGLAQVRRSPTGGIWERRPPNPLSSASPEQVLSHLLDNGGFRKRPASLNRIPSRLANPHYIAPSFGDRPAIHSDGAVLIGCGGDIAARVCIKTIELHKAFGVIVERGTELENGVTSQALKMGSRRCSRIAARR